MPAAFLIPETAPLQRHRLGALTSLGRHPENSVEIPDRSVSKFHAQIQRGPDGRHVLQDLGSRNGTWVSGRRTEVHTLGDGDEVVLGTVRFRYHEERAPGPVTGALRVPESAIGQSRSVTLLGRAGGGRATVQLTDVGASIEHRSSFDLGGAIFQPADRIDDIAQLRADYDKLRIAHELSADIRFDRDLDELLQAVVTRIFDMLPADRCAVLLMQEDGVTLEPRMVMERGGGAPLETMPLSQTVLNQAITDRKAILSSDTLSDGRFEAAESIVALAIRAAMCVPLIYEDSIFGVMHVDTRSVKQAFTAKDLQLFSAIANQTSAALKNAALVQEIQKESETRARLGRLLSPNLVEEVVAGKLDMSLGGGRRRAAVMFTDIRAFTSMSERMTAEEVTAMLNEYFEVMVDIVFRCGGTLDKYLGDGMMALFGVPKDDDDAAAKAVRAGLEMQLALRSLNRTRQARGEPAIAMGVGVNFGEVVWGALGSRKTMDYTVVGDVVNTASRLCSAAKGGEVLISETVRNALPESGFELHALEPAQVKGKAEPVPVYSVLALEGGPDLR
ncbi:MAG: GAF domain-containing protein [Deltaproteobacteria bacterium]|nr:GAF domain-containing protein [Deltaproteobacteria bacterium]